MNKKVLHTLEYDKIIERLSKEAGSVAGERLCKDLLPMTDLENIKTAQLQTTDAVRRIRKKHAPGFSQLKEIQPAIMRLEIDAILDCEDLLMISSVLDVAGASKRFLRPETEDEEPDSLSAFYQAIDPCDHLNNEIKRCILGIDEIADDASPKLKDIRRQQNFTKQSIQRTLNSLVTSSSMKTYLQDSVVTIRNGRYCIPVKQEHKSHVPGMIHDQSGSGSTVFVEPMAVVKLNNDLKDLMLKEAEEIQVILSGLSNSARININELKTNYSLLAQLDFILAKANYSEHIKGNAPDFNDQGFLDLKQARHPLLDIKKAVPVNVNLGKDFSMLIVTGPNTGGKTVSLKTVGLLSLMGQAGLHIPAYSGSSLCIFEEIYADIGDEQSIEQSLSTFSSHMKNIVEILDKADRDSLVLLDELCSGTDPTEGAALAQAILTRLYNYSARCMATTHYSELKIFAMSKEGVRNAACEFDVETLRPTYKLLIGLPGKSNAFAISEKLGLDKRIIDDARTRIDEGSVAFEDVLADIEINKKTAELERTNADAALKEADRLRKELEKEKEDLEKKKGDILRDAKTKAYEILKEAKDYADITIKDIRRVSKDVNLSALERTRTEVGRMAKDALEGVGDMAQKKKAVKKKLTVEDINKGTNVRVVSMGMDGVATGRPNSRGKVNVQLGSMNMTVSLDNLELLTEDESAVKEAVSGKSLNSKFAQPKKSGSGAGNIQYSKALGVSMELKLLGLTVDDALLELDKYLDDACMAHLEKVRIVHGKGTGALRDAVTHALRRDKRVKKMYQAEYGDGDAGVTYAELK